MRQSVVVVVLLASGVLASAQGLSPKAGAVSDGLYTNLYFGMNYRLPTGWITSFVAAEGTCERECQLLDLRAADAKLRRAITLTAEQLAAGTGVSERMI